MTTEHDGVGWLTTAAGRKRVHPIDQVMQHDCNCRKEDSMSRITVSAFGWVPPFAQGLVRDLRVRWALEEAGEDYEARLIGPEDQVSESYRRLQPFGQVPAYEEDGLTLFESGAIVLHVAERSEALMPAEPNARARTKTWMFAALNSVEPAIQNLAEIDLFHPEEQWAKLRRPAAVEAVQARLAKLATWLDGRDYLEDRFTGADLLMTTVLQNLRQTDLLAQVPVLDAYRLRCQARPAYEKALADQLAPFAANAPVSA
jgi:glutathione S-transferase